MKKIFGNNFFNGFLNECKQITAQDKEQTLLQHKKVQKINIKLSTNKNKK